MSEKFKKGFLPSFLKHKHQPPGRPTSKTNFLNSICPSTKKVRPFTDVLLYKAGTK
jgi:hypothetical protein